jgi:hypothetical protein
LTEIVNNLGVEGGPDSATKRVTICGCQFTIGLYGRGKPLRQKDLRFAVVNSPLERLVVGGLCNKKIYDLRLPIHHLAALL